MVSLTITLERAIANVTQRRMKVKRMDAPVGASIAVGQIVRASLPGEFDVRQNGSALNTNGIQLARIQVERFQDGWSNLGGAHAGVDCLGLEGGIGHQQNDIGVVMGEAAVLRLFLGAAGVSNADIRGDDDVRRARVDRRVVVVEGQRRAIVDLPERDSGGGGVGFEDVDAGFGIRRNCSARAARRHLPSGQCRRGCWWTPRAE